MPEQRFDALDALRGVAAIAVLTLHLPDQTIAGYLPGSYLAVDLFFLLSGFVLTHAYEDRLQAGLSQRTFMLQRYIRLAPCFLAGTLIGLGVAGWPVNGSALAPNVVLASAASSLFFLPTPFALLGDLPLFPLNFPAWSLFFELLANLVFVVLIVRAKGGVLLLTLLGAAALIASAVIHGSLDGGVSSGFAWGGLARVLFSFFAGVLVHRLWRRAAFGIALPTPLLCLAMVCVFAVPADGLIRVAFDCLAALVIFPAVVLLGANARPDRYAGVWSLLGLLSYPLYAIHAPLIRLFEIAAGSLTAGRPLAAYGIAGSAIVMGICIALALVLELLFDRPVRHWLSARRRSDLARAAGA